jgi:hypothetical protein
MVVVGEDGLVMVAVPGLPACAVQFPVPALVIVVEPPGKLMQLIVLSIPAFGLTQI